MRSTCDVWAVRKAFLGSTQINWRILAEGIRSRRVPAGILEQDASTTRMLVKKGRHIIDPAFDDHPTTICVIMLQYLGVRYEPAIGRMQHRFHGQLLVTVKKIAGLRRACMLSTRSRIRVTNKTAHVDAKSHQATSRDATPSVLEGIGCVRSELYGCGQRRTLLATRRSENLEQRT
jgi:hypothetical protein